MVEAGVICEGGVATGRDGSSVAMVMNSGRKQQLFCFFLWNISVSVCVSKILTAIFLCDRHTTRILRVCDNIHSWISLSGGDLAFSHQHGIYDFKFLKGFWRFIPEISLLFSLFCQS
jgi:hypothetical protein